MPILIALIDALVDGALIAAALTAFMGVLAAVSFTACVACVMMALASIVKAICGTPPRVIRREYINDDGRRVIEEIPYQPATNLLAGIARRHRELTER
jgi:Na+/proline symporter